MKGYQEFSNKTQIYDKVPKGDPNGKLYMEKSDSPKETYKDEICKSTNEQFNVLNTTKMSFADHNPIVGASKI